MEQRLRGVDIIGIIFAVLCMIEGSIALLMQPTWMRMFAEFGSELPYLTRIMLSPITALVVGFTPLVLVAEGVVRRRSEVSQVARCVVAIVAAAGLLVGSIAALYLPIVTLAGSVAP